MKKNKIYLILAIITSLLLFTTGALCNRCSAAEDPLTGEGEPPDEEPPEEEPPGEEPLEEEPPEEELSEPTIDLEIYEGPLYSKSDEVCYYRVKSIVTGNPTPEVEFSKDDSGGAWGKYKIQINLENPSDTYTLTATATNSEGTASDSLNLSWECNRSPEITEISFSDVLFDKSEQYDINVVATDPDDDVLQYEWSATEGNIENGNTNPIKWTAPDTSTGDDINITVVVNDGKGGTAEKTESVVLRANIIFIQPVDIGYVVNAGGVNHDSLIIGDSISNEDVRGFCTFDLSVLNGKEILLVALQMYSKPWGEPSFKGNMLLYYNDYYPLDSNDYYISTPFAGPFVVEDNNPLKYKNDLLNSTVQDRASSSGKLGFSFKYENSSTNWDNKIDGREYIKDSTNLIVGYYD